MIHRPFSTSRLSLALQDQGDQGSKPPQNRYLKKDSSPSAPPSSFGSQFKVEAEKLKGKIDLKGLWKKYGIPFAVYYSSLYFGGMVTCYLVLQSGVLGTDVLELVKMTPIPNYMDISWVKPEYGNLGGAILANEILEVVRMPVVLLTTPRVVRAWERWKAKKEAEKEKSQKS